MTLCRGDRWFRAQGPAIRGRPARCSSSPAAPSATWSIEGWGAWDAFYMTVITVTTVGYREVHPLSRAGRSFTVVLLVRRRRRGALHVHAARDGRRRGRPAEAAAAAAARTYARRPSRITSSSAATAASAASSPTSSAHRTCRSSSSSATPSACRRRIERRRARRSRPTPAARTCCKRVGIDRARGLIAAVGTDAENVYAVLSARVLRPDLFIVGRAETEDADAQAEARRRRPRRLAVPDRRACRWRRRRCGRRSWIS